ncbi:MAG: zinc-binding alcohol dehydrogenase family protein [Anaerolineae bacterium]|nr:zinc-binding alcohol dehydrogenase family protein [Anaerolineae bacterium]
MKTLVLDEPGHFTLTDTPEPAGLPAGEALIRVRRIGICGTDLKAFEGKMPFIEYPRILGHELGAEIVEIGPNDRGLKPGDRVSIEPYMNCGTCIACRRGKTNCCTSLKVLGVHTDGGMREFITVPVRKLHKSDVLSVDQLALVETLVIGAHAVRRAQPEAGEYLAVIGAGPIGLTVVAAAKASGAEIIIMDINDDRLAFAQQQLGVEHAINVMDHPKEHLLDLTSGDLPTQVFDATGNLQSMNQSFDYVASGGKLVFVGLMKENISFSDPEFHRREMTLLSSRNGTASDFKWVIDQVEAGAIDTQPWITHRASFETMIDQFPGWLDPATGVIKAVVEV